VFKTITTFNHFENTMKASENKLLKRVFRHLRKEVTGGSRSIQNEHLEHAYPNNFSFVSSFLLDPRILCYEKVLSFKIECY
jgi:hypothetical protein